MKKRNNNCKKCLPDWLAQFGDLMSLLLVFFILLLSMSVLNEQKVVEYLAHMRKSLGVMDNSSLSQVTTIKPIEKTTPMEKTSDDYQQTLNEITETVVQLNKRNKYNKEIENEEMDLEDFALLEVGKKSFVITLPAKILFEEGQYTMKNKNINVFLSNLQIILNKLEKKNIEVEVSGYASEKDKLYLNTLIHPKNLLELAFFRAESISRKIEENGFPASKLKTTSYGSNDIIDYQNDNKNRRVEIKIISKNFKSELNKHKKHFFSKIEGKNK